MKLTEADGSTLFLDPIRGDAVYGKLPEGVEVFDPYSIERRIQISVKLEATTNEEPDKPLELVSGSWPAHVLGGRQLRVGFHPVGELLTNLSSRIDDWRTFVPALSVQALDTDEKLEGRAGIG